MDWYTDHAKSLFKKRIEKYLPTFLQLGINKPKVSYRRMKKRWGSCSGHGVIILNPDLVKAPIHCIDYVIVHELCHLVSPKHDQKFYQFLERVLPDWKKRKERLEKVIL